MPLRRAPVFALALLLTLEVAPGGASAQPSQSPLNTPADMGAAAPAPVPAVAARGSRKDPNMALALSLGGTLGSLALISLGDATENETLGTAGALGIWLAPSFGHWYAGQGWTTGLKWRLAGTAAATAGIMWFAVECIPGCDDGAHPGLLLAIGGGVAFVGGVVNDIATAPRAAREHNARIEGWLRDVTVRPTFGSGRAGLAVGGRF